MSTAIRDTLPPLEKYHNYLLVLARALVDPRLHRKLDPEDAVQDACLRAVAAQSSFRGTSEAELVGWLRTILRNTLRDELRRVGKLREVPMDAFERSSYCVEHFLPDDQTSPSQCAQRHEEAVRVANALTQLPERQRRAIELQKHHGFSLAEIAREMDTTPVAVGGLLRHGLKNLRDLLV